MPKDGTNLIKKLNGFVKEKKSLDDVFSSQVDGKQKLFDVDGLPMYVRFSEKTTELRGGKDIYGVEKLVAKFGVEDLMKIINAGLKSDNELAVATADRVRAGLVSKSWREKMQPRDVAQLLKGGKVVMDRIHQGVYKKYLDAFNKANIAKPTA
ncbi:hypothetical protein JG687_00008978 [Phytophthora cactorum]|nr:hypothetical protein PC119_g8565 [Phytophthora cactorum]KAG3060252.1 hypothetical protein PC121_g13578 [Phytophthora cactorum]KAG3089625.1 hypothetical protein PC122_g7805 [Phytophthora cactorum]KAG4054965.1 hypothetical protein PC123_g9921 [Phytophthora cactorum]KAG6959128.1 hypothetical protein JG687_00008978 [Phytophthora cactorum]